MKVVVLGSSSSGNSTYVEMNNSKFLIDVGLGFNDIKNKLFKLGVYADEIDFILITHAHIDHVKSLHSFARIYNTKVYISKETYNEYSKKEYLNNYEFIDDIEVIDDIKITKIPISHDKKGFGYILEHNEISFVYMTDTGMIHSKYHELLKNRTIYLLESNHDVEMEMNGHKDYYTKIRNTGDMGHLSNDECAMYLSHFVGENTQIVMLMHISEHDNTYDLAYSVNRSSLDERIKLYISSKDEMSEIINI